MDKLELNDNCKAILSQLNSRKRRLLYDEDDYDAIRYLVAIGFINAKELLGKCHRDLSLTEQGRTYLYENPKLKNPSIWDDKKYWITTAISFAALIVSFIALLKD